MAAPPAQSQRLYREAAAALMEAGDWEGLLAACDRHGDAASGGDPQLWHDALQFFARQGDRDCTREVQALLARIEGGALLPPLLVLQALARNPRLSLDVVKGYVTRQLAGEAAAARGDAEEAEALRAEAERTRAQVDRLRTEVGGGGRGGRSLISGLDFLGNWPGLHVGAWGAGACDARM